MLRQFSMTFFRRSFHLKVKYPVLSHPHEVFLEVAQRLSFTKAGQALFISQSAVSKQVKALEEYYKAGLFERLRGSVQLTPAGQKLYQKLLQAKQLQQELQQEMSELNPGFAPAVHLREEVKMEATKMVVVPNGVGFRAEKGVGSEGRRMAFIGRFNGPRGARAAALFEHVFPLLLRGLPHLRLALIGGELAHLPAVGKTALAALPTAGKFGERVEVVGFSDDVPGWLQKTDLVIGAGRVAIEALGAGRAVLALGEACSAGYVSEDTYVAAAAANFGDILARQGSKPVDWALVLREAQEFLRQPHRVAPALQQRVRTDYDLATVAARVLMVHESARMQKAVPDFMPVLMYHKIPDVPPATKHQIFITKESFAKHLTYLREHNFTPITFRDYVGVCQRPAQA